MLQRPCQLSAPVCNPALTSIVGVPSLFKLKCLKAKKGFCFFCLFVCGLLFICFWSVLKYTKHKIYLLKCTVQSH